MKFVLIAFCLFVAFSAEKVSPFKSLLQSVQKIKDQEHYEEYLALEAAFEVEFGSVSQEDLQAAWNSLDKTVLNEAFNAIIDAVNCLSVANTDEEKWACVTQDTIDAINQFIDAFRTALNAL